MLDVSNTTFVLQLSPVLIVNSLEFSSLPLLSQLNVVKKALSHRGHLQL